MSCKGCNNVAASGYYDYRPPHLRPTCEVGVASTKCGVKAPGCTSAYVPVSRGGLCGGCNKAGCGGCVKNPCNGSVAYIQPYVTSKPCATEYYTIQTVKKKKEHDPCEPVEQPCQKRRCCRPEPRTLCKKYPPPREDCYPQDPRPYDQAFADGFESFKIGLSTKDRWNYFSNGKHFVADGGVAKLNKGLVINSKVFTKTYPEESDEITDHGYLDHFKYLAILQSDYQVPTCGEVRVEACAASRAFEVDRATNECVFGDAVTDPDSDLRLAASGINMLDTSTGLHLAMLMTNSAIYAVYEMLPFDNNDGCGDPKASFAAAWFVGGRNKKNPLCDYVTLGVALDGQKGALWYIDNTLVHQVVRPGTTPDPEHTLYITPGNGLPVKPECVRVGFGHFTYLDAFSPNGPSYVASRHHDRIEEREQALIRLSTLKYYSATRPLNRPAFKYDCENPESARLFGQGAIMKLLNFEVTYRC